MEKKVKVFARLVNEDSTIYALPNRIKTYARTIVEHALTSDKLVSNGVMRESVAGVATGTVAFPFMEKGLSPTFFNAYKREIMESVEDTPFIKLSTDPATIDGNVGSFVTGTTSYDSTDDAKDGFLGIAQKIGKVFDKDKLGDIIVIIDGKSTDLNGAVSMVNPPKPVAMTADVSPAMPNVVVKPLMNSVDSEDNDILSEGFSVDSYDKVLAFFKNGLDEITRSLLESLVVMIPKEELQAAKDAMGLNEAVGDTVFNKVLAALKTVPKNIAPIIAGAFLLSPTIVDAGIGSNLTKIGAGFDKLAKGAGTVVQQTANVVDAGTGKVNELANKSNNKFVKGVGNAVGGAGDIVGGAGNVAKGVADVAGTVGKVAGKGAGAVVDAAGNVGKTINAVKNSTVDKEKGTRTINFNQQNPTVDTTVAEPTIPDTTTSIDTEPEAPVNDSITQAKIDSIHDTISKNIQDATEPAVQRMFDSIGKKK